MSSGLHRPEACPCCAEGREWRIGPPRGPQRVHLQAICCFRNLNNSISFQKNISDKPGEFTESSENILAFGHTIGSYKTEMDTAHQIWISFLYYEEGGELWYRNWWKKNLQSQKNWLYLQSQTKRCHSSVGRAKDWKSLCPWFDSRWHHPKGGD